MASIPSVLIAVDLQQRVCFWNHCAEATLGFVPEVILGNRLADCPIPWDGSRLDAPIQECLASGESRKVEDLKYSRPSGKQGILGLGIYPIRIAPPGHLATLDREETVSPSVGGQPSLASARGHTSHPEGGTIVGCLLFGTDITERKALLSHLAHAQKLEAIGLLAAGIAHEINTPTQFVGDNTRFLKDAFDDVLPLLRVCTSLISDAKEGAVSPDLLEEAEALARRADVPYLMTEIPKAIEQSLAGLERVAKIVRAMKEFSHPGIEDMTYVDLNRALDSTITISRNEWKYVAEVETDYDEDLPPIPCLPGDLNQVFLNIIVNAAHAIADVVGDGRQQKGRIRVTSRRDGNWVEIRISDTGTGIPEDIQRRIFDPFFTTKEVGKGTGQGLALAHSIVTDRHKGSISVESVPGDGATFIIRLPTEQAASVRSEKCA